MNTYFLLLEMRESKPIHCIRIRRALFFMVYTANTPCIAMSYAAQAESDRFKFDCVVGVLHAGQFFAFFFFII